MMTQGNVLHVDETSKAPHAFTTHCSKSQESMEAWDNNQPMRISLASHWHPNFNYPLILHFTVGGNLYKIGNHLQLSILDFVTISLNTKPNPFCHAFV
jgi:hypothetical protein